MTPEEKQRRWWFAELLTEYRNGFPNEMPLFNEERWKLVMTRYWNILKSYDDDYIRMGIERAERESPDRFATASQLRGWVEVVKKSMRAVDREPIIEPQTQASPDNPLEQIAQRIERGEERNPANAVLAELAKVFPTIAEDLEHKQPPTPNEGDWCQACGRPLNNGHGKAFPCRLAGKVKLKPHLG